MDEMKDCIYRKEATKFIDKCLNYEEKLQSVERETLIAVKKYLDSIPSADVVEVVRCKDCIYWQKPQIKLHDGTYRDYEPGEYEKGSIFGGVELSVGINVGSFCAKYDKWHGNSIHQFMDENDFCSKGEKAIECTK